MTKWDLIGIALDQLISQWSFRQNDFETDGNDSAYSEQKISWIPKLTNSDGSAGNNDPMGLSKAIIITYNCHTNQLTCSICKVSSQGTVTSEYTMTATRWLMRLRTNFKKFTWLRQQVLMRDRARKNNKFFEELYKVFPRSLDEHLLGSDD